MVAELVPVLLWGMNDVALLMLGMLALALLLRGGWWLMNWNAHHPRSIVIEPGTRVDLPVIFRMPSSSRWILYVLLLSPPVAAMIMMIRDWDGIGNFLMEMVMTIFSLTGLFLFAIIFLLCPYTAWNIHWRRKDFIRFDRDQITYWSGFTSATVVPEKITMFRGRSWRFDLVDLFKGQLASSWFLEIIPSDENGKPGGREPVVLDLKAMNLGGSARAIARVAGQVYGDKFLVNNRLRA